MKQYIFALALIGLIALASADYTCTSDSYNQFRVDFGKKNDLTPE